MADDQSIEGEPSEQGKKGANEQLAVDMEAMIETTKDLGIPYSIEELQLKLDNGFGDFMRSNAEGRLKKAEQMSDDDTRKATDVRDAREVVDHAKNFEDQARRTIEFLEGIAKGQRPDNWSIVPEWHYYPYDGIYRHGVLRNNVTAERVLSEAGIKPSEATDGQKREIFRKSIIRNDFFLKQKSAKGEIRT